MKLSLFLGVRICEMIEIRAKKGIIGINQLRFCLHSLYGTILFNGILLRSLVQFIDDINIQSCYLTLTNVISFKF